jgi:hypothetical protein
MRSSWLRLLALLPVVLASVLVCSSARAATVTVGSPLTASFVPGTVGAGGILGINPALGEPGAHASSPVDGAVIGWRVLGEGGPFKLRVVRPEAAGTFLAGAASAPQTLGTYGLGTFTTDLPIEAGEIVGIQAAEKPGSAPRWRMLPARSPSCGTRLRKRRRPGRKVAAPTRSSVSARPCCRLRPSSPSPRPRAPSPAGRA